MKKVISILLVLVLSLGLLTACSSGSADDKTITVGASVTPHAEILRAVEADLAAQGYTLKVVEYNDYVLPNTATESGELDANYFQHQPYLTDFNANNDTHLVSVTSIHYEPFGVYAGKVDSLDALVEGSTIAIPNDGTNEARALYLLEAEGLITLKEGIGFTATVLDIAENPLNLTFKEMEAAMLPNTVEEVDLSVINVNYALEAGFNPMEDALAIESSDSPYVNILVVKEGNEKNEAVLALIECLHTDAVRNFILEKYEGAVVPAF